MFDPTILARETVWAAVTGRPLPVPPKDIAPEWRRPGGAFVSIKKKGALRCCIGTFNPNTPSLAEEIVQNAIGSATRDWRFTPITRDELEDLTFSVDVLEPPEAVSSPEELDPKRFGIIVEAGNKRGLLLPDLEGVETVDDQMAIARKKGGIDPAEPVSLYRFRVTRYR